jgi:FkbM family methyltransferase
MLYLRKIIRKWILELVRKFFGDEFLPPIDQFVLAGYNQRLYYDLNLNPNSTVIVLGGYRGFSTSIIYENYKCNIIVFEPVPEFYTTLTHALKSSKVKILQAAASIDDRPLEIYVNENKSGINNKLGMKILVPSMNFDLFVQKQKPIDLLEINIEGYEYTLLSQLIKTGSIIKIKSLLIQFHNQGVEDEYKRALIRKDLRQTHKEVFCFEWIWEKWELISTPDD